MRSVVVLLQNGLNPARSDELYDAVAHRLAAQGVTVVRRRNVPLDDIDWNDIDLFVSNIVIADTIRRLAPCYGAYRLSRPEHMRLLERCGLPVMPWVHFPETRALTSLFDQWGVDRLLAKRTMTFGGKGVTAFTRDGIALLPPHTPDDILCPELRSDSGEVFKVEVYGGDILIRWKSRSPPLRERMSGPSLEGIPGAYGERSLSAFPKQLDDLIRAAARRLSRLGFGLCSIDFMLDRDDNFLAIEANLGLVAAWWTVRFPFFTENYAAAILRQAEACRRRIPWLRPRPHGSREAVLRWIGA